MISSSVLQMLVVVALPPWVHSSSLILIHNVAFWVELPAFEIIMYFFSESYPTGKKNAKNMGNKNNKSF